jgi:hypothetical protein
MVHSVKIGSKNVLVKQPDGIMAKVTISNVKYVPGLCVNLFSLTQPLKQGWRLSNEGLIMKIQKGPHSIVFDQIMDTASGVITSVILIPVVNINLQSICLPTAVLVPVAGASVPATGDPVPVAGALIPATVPNPVVVCRDVNALHHLFGYPNLDPIRRIKCVGMTPFIDCALAKIQQKLVPKITSSCVKSPG